MLALVSLGVSVATLGTAFAMTFRKHVCPSCHVRAMRCVATRRLWSSDGGRLERMYRCLACHAQHMRQGKGAFVAKAVWDAGGRGELPEARVHRD